VFCLECSPPLEEPWIGTTNVTQIPPRPIEQPQVLQGVFQILQRAVSLGNCCVRAVNVRHRTCTTLAHRFKAQQSSKSQTSTCGCAEYKYDARFCFCASCLRRVFRVLTTSSQQSSLHHLDIYRQVYSTAVFKTKHLCLVWLVGQPSARFHSMRYPV
jgi:hypothetical protein